MEINGWKFKAALINASQTLEIWGWFLHSDLWAGWGFFLKLVLTFIQVSSFYSESARIFYLESHILVKIVSEGWYSLGFSDKT